MIPYDGVEPKEGFSRIPMWVADMSFPTAPPVLEAIRARLDHPNFGYFQLSDAYFDSIIRWQQVRHGVTGLERQHIGYENGVLGGVSSVVQALTCPGEPILVHSPTYVGFTHTLERLGRPIIHTPLTQDAEGIWRMDYADMDRKLRENDIHVAILCSPHNPCGRVWERWELEKAMEVYAANDCTVISDEIWSDLIMPGYTHIPTQSVSRDARERTVAFYAPTKTFSLAGLIGSYHIIYNDRLRCRVQRQGNLSGYNDCNVLSMHALTGAYSDEGMAWVDQLCAVLDRNLRYIRDFLQSRYPGVTMMLPQGTYMLFVNCGAWCRSHGITPDDLRRRNNVIRTKTFCVQIASPDSSARKRRLFVDAHRYARQFNGGLRGKFGFLQVALNGEDAVLGVGLFVLQFQLDVPPCRTLGRAREPAVLLQEDSQIGFHIVQAHPLRQGIEMDAQFHGDFSFFV